MKKYSKGPKIGVEISTLDGAITRSRLFLSDSFCLIGPPHPWIEAYLEGAPFSLLLTAGTPYQQKILQALQEIPFGQTISYGDLALLAGSPRGARAVGNACNRNPFPLLVPCHRVVHKNGSMGGFAYDLEIKRRLLEFEAGHPCLKQN